MLLPRVWNVLWRIWNNIMIVYTRRAGRQLKASGQSMRHFKNFIIPQDSSKQFIGIFSSWSNNWDSCVFGL